MSLNWKEINLVLRELDLEGARIQKVRQPDYTHIVLDLYKPRRPFSLYVALSPGFCRLHELSQKVQGMSPAPRFVQFLRSNVVGRTITQAYQLGEERIVKLAVHRAGDELVLWFRLWSGAANIIVTDAEGTVLDAFHRRPKRDEVSGGSFLPEQEIEAIAGKRRPLKEFQVRDLPGDGSFNERVEAWYTTQERDQLLRRLQSQVEQQFRRRMDAVKATLNRLRHRKDQYEEFAQYKEYGDLVVTNIHAMAKGDRWLETANYYRDGAHIRIPLDPQKSPSENAEAYYQRYKKAKSGLDAIEEEIHNHLSILATLRDERERVLSSDDPAALASYVRHHKQQSRRTKDGTAPGLVFQSNGFTVLVGRTAKENDELLRHYVRGNDYWLHSRDYPGAYVFIKARPGKSIPLDTLLDAGNLALRYSKARNAGQGELYYTQVKYLRRVKDGKRGLVIPTQEKNLSVRLEEGRLERLHSIDAFGDS